MAAIVVNDVKKKFRVYSDKSYSLKERLLFHKRNLFEDRWVLSGISFQVEKGEAIGLIGQNGCGKSTLLKMLTRIMYPDAGEIKTQGRVSSLIELGAGFHPDMSGRENIYTNAAIFGLTKKEIDSRISDIISFSGLEEFVDNPVRTYSSGMYMRLAFSVAINVDADILLIDEILAVGDASFQAKCFNRLREIKAAGTTIVIVSHSLGQIEQICERSIWIDSGKIREIGAPRDVHPSYMEYMGMKLHAAEEPEEAADGVAEGIADIAEEEAQQSGKRWGNGDATITEVVVLGKDGKKSNSLQTGGNATVKIHYKMSRQISRPNIGIVFNRNDNIYCYGNSTQLDRLGLIELKESGWISFVIESLPLLPAEYTLDVAIASEAGFDCDHWQSAAKISVYSDIQDIGICRINHSWVIE